MNKRDAILVMVEQIRVHAERSPGLSTAPFSPEGWKLIEDALRETPYESDRRDAIIEECAAIAQARNSGRPGLAGAFFDTEAAIIAGKIRALGRQPVSDQQSKGE